MNLYTFYLNILMVLSVFLYSCKDDDSNYQTGYMESDEVRVPKVIENNDKVVISWIDPYITDLDKIQVTDMQTNQIILVNKGIQKAEFPLPNFDANAYRYELKVLKTTGEVSNGIITRLIMNWAQHIHPQIDYNSKEIPQSGMFFKNKPVDKVLVYDIRQDDNISKLTSAIMQGVLNQEFARTYLIWQDQDLSQLKDAECNYELVTPISISKNKGFATLFNQFKDEFKYLIIWDENQPWSWSLAQMISSQEKGIPVTEELKTFIEKELGGIGNLVVNDIRDNWNSKEEAYQWALDNYATRCHPKLSFSGGLRNDYKDAPWRMYDYVAASKGFVFWLDESNGDDKRIMDNIFKTMNYPVGSSVFGYGMNANGDDLNTITNLHNCGFVVSDYYANGSFWCSYPNKSFQQRTGVPGEVQPRKIYVAISLSDGDNVQFDANSLYRIFKEGKGRGKVPVGVTLAAGLQELNPKLLEFYYKNKTDNDELTAGPSGFQFIYGDQFAQSGKYDEWINMNNKWLSTAGFHTAHLWRTDNRTYFEQYMEGSGVDAVLDGSDLTHNQSGSKIINNVVRINQGTHCRKEGDVYRDLMSLSPSERRPLFRHVYLLTNYYGFDGDKVVIYERLMRELQRIEEDCPNTYEFMLPMDLAASIKKYVEEGGIY